MEPFYRAALHLEKVEPYTDERGHAHARITEIASLGFTGADADDAMYQMRNHVETLHDWHETQADQAGTLDEAVLSDSDLLKRLRVMFEHQDELTAREAAKKVIDDIIAAEARHDQAVDTATVGADCIRQIDETGRPFVACKAPDPLNPNFFCGRRLGHGEIGCVFVPVEELPASADDEGDETAVKQDPDFDAVMGKPWPSEEQPDDELGRASAALLAEKPAPTAWCGNPDHTDPCDDCEAVLADASDALRQRMPTGHSAA